MRLSLRFVIPAALLAFVALKPVIGAFAEEGEVENGMAEGSQIAAEGTPPFIPGANNLNTVPEDGASVRSFEMPDSPWVKRLLTARSKEDLVICIAGCYSDRDRVVYAQPTTIPPRTAEAVAPSKPKHSAAVEPRNPASVSRTN